MTDAASSEKSRLPGVTAVGCPERIPQGSAAKAAVLLWPIVAPPVGRISSSAAKSRSTSGWLSGYHRSTGREAQRRDEDRSEGLQCAGGCAEHARYAQRHFE